MKVKDPCVTCDMDEVDCDYPCKYRQYFLNWWQNSINKIKKELKKRGHNDILENQYIDAALYTIIEKWEKINDNTDKRADTRKRKENSKSGI